MDLLYHLAAQENLRYDSYIEKRSFMNKRTIGIVIGIILAVIGFWYITQPSEETKAEPSNHTLGTSDVGVTLIEYGDFQCPACGSYHPILQQVKELYKDRVVFQFRHFPLEALHKNARAASYAAEAAGNQGKFWEMHDYLFENQQAWQETNDPVGVFEGYARAIGVEDMARFSEDYRKNVSGIINADLEAGRALGASSTPTFVLDGKKLDDNPPASVEAFAKLLDDALIAKGGTPLIPQEQSTTPEETTPTEQPAQ